MKKFAVKTTALLIAAGLGVGAAGSAFAAESLQDVMKRRNLTQQDLLDFIRDNIRPERMALSIIYPKE